jgi:hypothetical chaperone protein
MNYLGVDFGTTNSLAGVLDELGKLKLVPLEGDEYEMPSSIFLKVVHEPPMAISEDFLDSKVQKYLSDDQKRYADEQASLIKKINDFIQTNKPRLKKPKPTYSFSNADQRKLEQYERDLKDYPKTYQMFLDDVVKKKELEYKALIKPVTTLEEAKHKVRLAMEQELIEAELEGLGEQTFFTALNSDDAVAYFGAEALRQYLDAPLSGFFMGSPKAFLAVQLTDSQKELFTRVMTLILSEIKTRSEKYLGFACDGLVVGRPVNYMGSEHGGGNQQAIAIMRKAAISAGFNEVRFVVEPMAAALAISKTIFESNLPILLLDIGGGTTDAVTLNIDSDSNSEERLAVISSAGERIGGCDFDQSIAIAKFGPSIGLNAELKNGVSAPNNFVIDALSTRDIYKQAKFRKSGLQINNLISTSSNPIAFQRLLQTMQQQLQHRFLLNAEELKKKLLDENEVSLHVDFLMHPFSVSLARNQVREVCEIEIKQVLSIVREVLFKSQNELNHYRVFVTGGMSISAELVNAIQEVIKPGISMRRIPALRSVVAGLIVIARQLSLAQSIHTEPTTVRGIPIEH